MRTLQTTGLAVLAALAVMSASGAAAQTSAPKQGTAPKTAPRPSHEASGRHAGGETRPAKPAGTAEAQPTPGAGPVIVVETAKGAFEFETYPDDAPKTVANFLALTKKGFFNGQRFHRVVPGFVIQAGDPQTRDMSKRDQWGRGSAAGSGKPSAWPSSRRSTSTRRARWPWRMPATRREADSQFYVTLAPKPALDGKYAVFGHVISGADVPAKIEVGDVIKRMYVKGAPGK